MTKEDKLFLLNRIFSTRRTAISAADLAERLECSERSVNRYIKQLRDGYGAPLLNAPGGWFYDRRELRERTWEMPGLWLTKDETHSLLLLLVLLERFGHGLLGREMKNFEERLDQLAQARGVAVDSLRQCIHITPMGERKTDYQVLAHAVNALIDRKQLVFNYEDFRRQATRRTVSPQRLRYYRDNWYLHAWCHTRQALRTFSIARMTEAVGSRERARKVDERKLDVDFDTTYGIFTGGTRKTARLRFLPPLASEIARQQWHPKQKRRWAGEHYLLSVPYSHAEELLQDVMRCLPCVVVEGPPALRKKLLEALAQAQAQNRPAPRAK